MRKLVSIVIFLVVAVALLAVATGGYLWYGAKQQVDQIVAMAKPFAEISYGSVAISPSGSVGVRRLRVMPKFVNDSIMIGAIQLNFPNFLALLHARWQLSQNQLPEALSLSFQDVELSLSGGILGAATANAEKTRSPFDHLDALGCGPVIAFGAAEWREMGYTQFVGAMEIGYRIDPKNNMLELRMESSSQNWAALHLDIGLGLTRPPESLAEFAVSFTPKLAKLNFVLRDDGFNQRRNAYCAAKAGKPLPDYLADHVQQVAERLRANGVLLSPGLVAAYQRYLGEGGTVMITANPPALINPAELHEYAPADIVKLLGLRMKVNEAEVTDLTVDWDAAKITKALNLASEPEPEPEPEPKTTPATVSPSPVVAEKIYQTYHPIPVGELSRHVGKVVKLRTTNGTPYRGTLDAVMEGMIRVTVRKSGGSAMLSLRASEITEVAVLY